MARQCGECEGPKTACPTCHHYHCDDPECEGMPVPCAEAVQQTPAEDEADGYDDDVEEGRLRARDYDAWANL